MGNKKMKKNMEKSKIPVEIEFTDGYQKRFTVEVLKIYEKRRMREEQVKNNQSA